MTDDKNGASSFESEATQGRRSLIREMWGWVSDSGKWWLMPILAVMLVLGALVILSTTGLGPFIYALF